MKKRLLASFLSLVLILGLLPTAALAAGIEDDGLCPHHTEHTAECGYAAPTEETPCAHVHTAECYSDGTLPTEGEEKVADVCTHVHDAECGYSEGSEGSPCTFVCSICPVESMIEALPAYADATPEDVADIEAAQAAYDGLTEEEQAAVDSGLAAKLAALSELAVLLADTQNTIDAEPLDNNNMRGSCGAKDNENDVTWVLTANSDNPTTYTLTISGKGAMKDFGTNDAPWKTALKNIEGGTYTGKTTNGDKDRPRTFYRIDEIVIENGVTNIGNNAFSYTDVSKITIPNSVTTIGTGVFTWTLQLKEINIPASVTNLNHTESNGAYTYYNTFDGAFNLEKITVDAGSQNYAVTGGVLIGKIPSTDNDWMIVNCPDKLAGTTQINASVFNGYNITAVGRTAFSACANLTSIDLPDTVKDIQAGAFNKCYSLTSFTVPAGVTEFGGNFSGCSSLRSVDWNNVTSITVADVFAPFWADEVNGQEHTCSVRTTDLSKVTNIADNAFQDSQLSSVTFSDSHDLYIGAQAFADCENWEMYELDFSYGNYVAFNAFDGTEVYNIIFPNEQSSDAVVELVRGQRTFYLESFDAAIDAVQDGDILRLIQDATLSKEKSIAAGNSITLDLNGHVLRFVGESGRLFTVYGTLNIQDSNPTTEHKYKVNESKLWVLDETGERTLSGGVITGGNHKQFSGGAIMATSGGILNMSGGNIVGNQTSANGSGGVATSGGSVNITGGSVMGNISTSGGAHIADLAGSGYSISGGTFTTPLELDWCSGILQPHDNGDGTYTVSYEGQGVARIGNTYYETFNDAFNAAKEMENATIVVMADTELTGVCQLNTDSEAEITIDLNGYVLTAADNNRLFTVQGGTLNIQDSNPDEVHYYKKETSGLWTLYQEEDEDATAIYGGIITGGNCGNSGGAIVVTNSGTVNVYGGNIIGNTTTNSASNASGGVSVSGSGTFHMYGGSIQGNIYSNSAIGVRDINGGTIYGGTFTTNVSTWVAEGYSAKEIPEGSGVYVVTKSVDEYTIATIPNQVYTGEEIKPNVIVMKSGRVLEPTEYSVAYSSNINAGTATARVTITDDSKQETQWPIEVTFRIIRDESPDIQMAPVDITYGGTYTMTASATTSAGNTITGDDAITIDYYTNPGCEGSAMADPPTDAGIYYVKATLNGTGNYAETFTVATLTIKRADFQVSANGYAETYDGQPHSISVTAEDDVTVTYSRNGYTYTAENPTFTDTGTYTVYYKAEKQNYNDVTGVLTVNISKAPLTATYPGEAIRFGQTPALTVIVTGFVNGETAATAAGYQAPTISNAPTGVGQYPLTPTGGAADNYTFNYVSGTLVIRSSGGSAGSSSSTRYTVSVDAGRNGDVTVSPSRASYGDTVTITVDPDNGYELDELIVTDSDGDEISVRSRGNGRYTFTMPRGRVTVEATFVEITEDPDLLTFTDVLASAYYYDAVYWAVENGVTNGTSASTFSPNASCTRAQMVTFLWRAAGSPEPESTVNPFTDVSASAYYYDAVLWAVEQGITNGTSATTFGPDATVTRGQTVTFLWRYDGSTAVSGSGFADVASDAYYADAVAWAASEGITSGTSATTFSPSNDCTRGQIVTFLYRYMA